MKRTEFYKVLEAVQQRKLDAWKVAFVRQWDVSSTSERKPETLIRVQNQRKPLPSPKSHKAGHI